MSYNHTLLTFLIYFFVREGLAVLCYAKMMNVSCLIYDIMLPWKSTSRFLYMG